MKKALAFASAFFLAEAEGFIRLRCPKFVSACSADKFRPRHPLLPRCIRHRRHPLLPRCIRHRRRSATRPTTRSAYLGIELYLCQNKTPPAWVVFCFGRGRRIRTLGTRFWRPLLYQLSYTPISTFQRPVPSKCTPKCTRFGVKIADSNCAVI